MSQVRDIIALISKTRISGFFALSILILLFIYPNPDGMIFSLLRASFIGIAILLFFEIFKSNNNFKSNDSYFETEKELREDTKMNDVSLRVRFLMDLMADIMPGFGIAYYEYSNQSDCFLLVETAGEDIGFITEFSPNDNSVSVSISDGKFITPGENPNAVKFFFSQESKISDSSSLLTLPIRHAGSSGGALVVHSHQFSDFRDYHKPLGESFALALSTINREMSIGDLTSEHFSFFQQLESFQADLDIVRSKEQFVDAIIEFCRKNFTFDKLSLILFSDEEKNEALAEKIVGYNADFITGTKFQRQASLLWKILDQKEPLICDLAELEPEITGRFNDQDLKKPKFFSYIGVPIKSKGEVMGCLILESFISGRYNAKEGGNLQILCSRLGLLLDWWKKYNVVRETAMHDSLTGLLNHGSFIELFEQELQRVGRYNEELVLLILDLDKFKRINDTYGHLYGDYVLRETSEILKNAVRNIDIVARYGGEEFAIVLVKAGKKGSIETARRIVMSVAKHDFKYDGISVHMTISAGMAEYPFDGKSVRDLIGNADSAMYEAKKQGGNDVGIAANDSFT